MYRASLLKPFVADDSKHNDPWRVLHQSENGHEEHVSEGLLVHRRRRGQRQVLVKYKEYSDHDSSWEPETNIQHCQELPTN